jgi:hypothetical protein
VALPLFLLDFLLAFLLGAAALPAMPATAPRRAQRAMTAPIWGSLIRLMAASLPGGPKNWMVVA